MSEWKYSKWKKNNSLFATLLLRYLWSRLALIALIEMNSIYIIFITLSAISLCFLCSISGVSMCAHIMPVVMVLVVRETRILTLWRPMLQKLNWPGKACAASKVNQMLLVVAAKQIYMRCRKILRIYMYMCTTLNEHVLYKRSGPGRIWRSQKKKFELEKWLTPFTCILLFCHHPIIGQRSSCKMMIAWVKDLLRFRRTLTQIRTCVYDVRSNEQTHMCQRRTFGNVQMYVLILLRFACHTHGSSTLPSPCILRKCIRV